MLRSVTCDQYVFVTDQYLRNHFKMKKDLTDIGYQCTYSQLTCGKAKYSIISPEFCLENWQSSCLVILLRVLKVPV